MCTLYTLWSQALPLKGANGYLQSQDYLYANNVETIKCSIVVMQSLT